MGSMPLCLRFSRLMMDNACTITKLVQPSIWLNNSMCITPWRPASPGMQRPIMNFTATEGKNLPKSDTVSASTEGKDAQTSGNETYSEQELKKQVEYLTQEVESLTKQSQDYTDKYKRALADGENLRQRLTKQIEDASQFGTQGFCKDLLEVSDILRKATECVPKEELSDKNPHLKTLFEGLTMTDTQLTTVFKRHGLVEVNPLDEKFNPNLHEALFEKEIAGKEPGIVISVSKVGTSYTNE